MLQSSDTGDSFPKSNINPVLYEVNLAVFISSVCSSNPTECAVTMETSTVTVETCDF